MNRVVRQEKATQNYQQLNRFNPTELRRWKKAVKRLNACPHRRKLEREILGATIFTPKDSKLEKLPEYLRDTVDWLMG